MISTIGLQRYRSNLTHEESQILGDIYRGVGTIEKRPVVVDDAIAIQTMAYLTLGFDHRLVDGREAVQFLVRIKEFIEDPGNLLLES